MRQLQGEILLHVVIDTKMCQMSLCNHKGINGCKREVAALDMSLHPSAEAFHQKKPVCPTGPISSILLAIRMLINFVLNISDILM